MTGTQDSRNRYNLRIIGIELVKALDTMHTFSSVRGGGPVIAIVEVPFSIVRARDPHLQRMIAAELSGYVKVHGYNTCVYVPAPEGCVQIRSDRICLTLSASYPDVARVVLHLGADDASAFLPRP